MKSLALENMTSAPVSFNNMQRKDQIISVMSWVIVAWICKVFLSSLPYKFTGHPDTQHIFGTIGLWIQETVNTGLGGWFTSYGAYIVGAAELITSLALLAPVVFWGMRKTARNAVLPTRSLLHCLGGLAASVTMMGAVFFHLFTPLGIEVLHEGKSDHGSLFYAAVSILVLGFGLFIMNWRMMRNLQYVSQLKKIKS